MSGLVEFLRERLDEDEALALEAPPGPWQIGNAVDPTQPCNVNTFPGVRPVADGLNWLVAEHIARQNPARVLADIEGKRRIVERHGRCGSMVGYCDDGGHGWDDIEGGGCADLADLALPFAAHPDYREEWKP